MLSELYIFENFMKILDSKEQREILERLFRDMEDWSEWSDDKSLYFDLRSMLNHRPVAPVRKKLARILRYANKCSTKVDKEVVERLRGIGKRTNEEDE